MFRSGSLYMAVFEWKKCFANLQRTLTTHEKMRIILTKFTQKLLAVSLPFRKLPFLQANVKNANFVIE